jgi:hypothetical protein
MPFTVPLLPLHSVHCASATNLDSCQKIKQKIQVPQITSNCRPWREQAQCLNSASPAHSIDLHKSQTNLTAYFNIQAGCSLSSKCIFYVFYHSKNVQSLFSYEEYKRFLLWFDLQLFLWDNNQICKYYWCEFQYSQNFNTSEVCEAGECFVEFLYLVHTFVQILFLDKLGGPSLEGFYVTKYYYYCYYYYYYY